MEKVTIKPKIGIVCGSGLGGLGDRLENPNTIPYSMIPNFPSSTGRLNEICVIFFQICHLLFVYFLKLLGTREI